jgi:predicted N-acetyltransferase YhbS
VIEAALYAARSAGERVVVVLGHPDYYPRFGFQVAADFGITLGIGVPREALMVMSLDASESIPSGVVCYAAPFGVPC